MPGVVPSMSGSLFIPRERGVVLKVANMSDVAQEDFPYIVSTTEMERSKAWLEEDLSEEPFSKLKSQRSEVREGRFYSISSHHEIPEIIDPEVMRKHTAAKTLDLHQLTHGKL